MAHVNYPQSSPYGASSQTSWYLGRYVHREIGQHDDDLRITLTARHVARPDLLSHELYGTPVYWWVFGVCNPKLRLDPVWGMKTGMIIRAPSVATIRSLLGG